MNEKTASRLRAFLGRHRLVDAWLRIAIQNRYALYLKYPINPKPRWGYGQPPHEYLYSMIDARRAVYAHNLTQFAAYSDALVQIPAIPPRREASTPAYINGWLPGLDAVALYCFIAMNNPKRYFEVGSGNSTKFARRSIQDNRLRTRITSFDPQPRAEIDTLCDTVVRAPLEECDLSIFSQLDAGDILFIDNSHTAFQNSDVVVCMLDILPRLRSGVLVEFHDILLPWDYPYEYGAVRYYNEQYLLASHLLAKGHSTEIVLPNEFVSRDPQLSTILHSLWDHESMKGVSARGGSFWLKVV